MKRFVLFAFLAFIPAAAIAQHSEFSLIAPVIALTPAFAYPEMSDSGIRFAVGLEYLHFLDDRFGLGAGAEAGFFSPEETYPYQGGFTVGGHACAAAKVLRERFLELMALVRAGIMLSFSDVFGSATDLAGVYFRGDVSVGLRFPRPALRLLVGVETVDFQTLAVRFEFGLSFGH